MNPAPAARMKVRLCRVSASSRTTWSTPPSRRFSASRRQPLRVAGAGLSLDADARPGHKDPGVPGALVAGDGQRRLRLPVCAGPSAPRKRSRSRRCAMSRTCRPPGNARTLRSSPTAAAARARSARGSLSASPAPDDSRRTWTSRSHRWQPPGSGHGRDGPVAPRSPCGRGGLSRPSRSVVTSLLSRHEPMLITLAYSGLRHSSTSGSPAPRESVDGASHSRCRFCPRRRGCSPSCPCERDGRRTTGVRHAQLTRGAEIPLAWANIRRSPGPTVAVSHGKGTRAHRFARAARANPRAVHLARPPARHAKGPARRPPGPLPSARGFKGSVIFLKKAVDGQ